MSLLGNGYNHKITAPQLRRILKRYEDGDDTDEIADDYGLSRGYVSRLARRHKLKMRGQRKGREWTLWAMGRRGTASATSAT